MSSPEYIATALKGRKELEDKIAKLLFERTGREPLFGVSDWDKMWPENKKYYLDLAKDVLKLIDIELRR